MSIISIGEILWDVFEDARHIGGAPFNLAVQASRLEPRVAFISAVGDDELGREALQYAAGQGLDTRFIRTVQDAPTGTADIFLRDGVPDFTINRPAAYDFPSLDDDDMQALAEMKPTWIAFGTLNQLAPDVRATTRRLMEAFPTAGRFYDVNLRKESYTPELVRELLQDASVVKLSDEEMAPLGSMLGIEESEPLPFAEAVAARCDLECACVTLGADGCALWGRGESVQLPGRPVEVADTVGAGDAFAAVLMVELNRRDKLCEVADRANRLGAFVASKRGALPEWTPAEVWPADE